MDNKNIPVFPDPMRAAAQSFSNQSPENLPTGMTLRQWYAGLAMNGCLASCSGLSQWPNVQRIAEQALEYTDALIEALNKPTDSPTP